MGLSKHLPITPEGGITVRLINKTGAPSVKGSVIHASSTVNGAFALAVVDVPDPIGIVYEEGVADGDPCLVVISGIADVSFIGNTTRGHLARGFITGDAGYAAGKALSEAIPTSPFFIGQALLRDRSRYRIKNRRGAG